MTRVKLNDHAVLVPVDECSPCAEQDKRSFEGLNEHDAIISVDQLNSWHWCPSALARQRALDGPINEFLAQARAKGALVIHAVSDNKPHYLNQEDIRPAVRTKAQFKVPEGPGRDWFSVGKSLLRSYDPPPPTSLSLDRVCGDDGRSLFTDRKPKWMPGLNANGVDVGYDIITIDMDVVYSSILNHPPGVKRILYVGVHLELCLLYTRWFSVLRAAKFWGLPVEFAYVTNLVDVSNTNQTRPFSEQLERDQKQIDKVACWIKCVAFPNFVGGTRHLQLYKFDRL